VRGTLAGALKKKLGLTIVSERSRAASASTGLPESRWGSTSRAGCPI
jgi:hypothetical protein